jgi:hypothetical protein
MQKQKRVENLMPNGIPKWIRVFDNGGKTFDRYTVVYTHAHSFGLKGYTVGVGMSENPYHPQGFGQHFEYDNARDLKGGTIGACGKRIAFQELPPDCQKLVLSDYKEYWKL